MNNQVKIIEWAHQGPLAYLQAPLTQPISDEDGLVFGVRALGSSIEGMSIEWAHVGPLVYMPAPLTQPNSDNKD